MLHAADSIQHLSSGGDEAGVGGMKHGGNIRERDGVEVEAR